MFVECIVVDQQMTDIYKTIHMYIYIHIFIASLLVSVYIYIHDKNILYELS